MQAHTDNRPGKWRKWAVSLLVGGLAGFAGASLLMNLVEGGALGELSGSQVGALGVAMVYLLMGLAVLVGAAAPRAGSTFLNVEDADELREQRAAILPSAIACLAMAAGLTAVALAAAAGMVTPAAALAGFGMALVVATWLSLMVVRHSDELMRQVMRDGASASYYLTFAVLGGWALLAHLGYAAAPAMLDIVSLFFALTLVGCFWVIGRRGMLMR